MHLILSSISLAFLALRYPRKDLIKSNWDDALVFTISNHRICLTRSSLSVCKKTAMIALPGIVEHLAAQNIIYFLLISIVALAIFFLHDAVHLFKAVMRPQTVIKSEVPLYARDWLYQLSRLSKHSDAALRISPDFSINEWTNADRNFYTHLQIFHNGHRYRLLTDY